MESVAPISDLITGTVLYNKLVEDVISGETDLTLTEYRILFFLSESDEHSARIHTLAEALVLKSSTVSDAVKELETKRLILKIDHQNDLKAVWARITDEGMNAFAVCCEIILNETQEYWSAVGREVSERYFFFSARLLRNWQLPLKNALQLPAPLYYTFVSRRHMLSYVSWFKSTYNLGLIDVRILMLLLERDKALSGTEIAHLLKVSSSTVSNSIRYLTRVRHYMSRTRKSANHAIDLALTAEGTDTISAIRDRFIRFNMEQFDITRDEFETMIADVHPRHRKSYMQKVFGEDFGDN